MPLCPDFRVARVGCSLPFGGLKGILKYEQQSWQKDAFIQGAAAERDQLNICLIYDCARNRFRAKLNCFRGLNCNTAERTFS